MPVPTQATFSAAALAAAHTSFKNLIDAGSAGGSIKIRDASDVLLATIPLTDPCGTIDNDTGQLTLTPAGRDESADAAGTAAYGEYCDSDGVVHLSLPTQAGGAPVLGKLVINTLSIVAGGPVEVLSATVG
jgi:hypothetical protein